MSERSAVVDESDAVAPESVVEFLAFRLGDARCALEVGRVGQVVWRPVATRVPEAPPGIYGAATVEGEVTVAVDTYAVVGLDRPFDDPADAYLILLNREETPQPVGLLVEAVDGLERHHVDTVSPPREGASRLDDRWYRAIIAEDDAPETAVIDCHSLLAAIHTAEPGRRGAHDETPTQ